MTETREATGIDLSVVTLGKHASYFAEQYNWAGAIVEGLGTKSVYMICTEGVGYDITTWTAEEVFNEFGHTFDQIEATIKSGDAGYVALEKHIRQFGARLESNFWQWSQKLKSLSAN